MLEYSFIAYLEKIKIPHLTVEEYRIHHIIINPETENAIINQEKIDLLIEYFEKNKIINQDNINKKCNYCKENIPNLKLNCGCIVCFNCEKNMIGKKCLKCNKDIIDTIQISCGICFQNKRELIKLPCQCSFVICKLIIVLVVEKNILLTKLKFNLLFIFIEKKFIFEKKLINGRKKR